MGVIPAEECTFTPAVQVGFDAEQGEPFGANTPSGSVVMSIYNAEIAEALIALFHAHMCDRTAGSKPPLFEVTFRRVED